MTYICLLVSGNRRSGGKFKATVAAGSTKYGPHNWKGASSRDRKRSAKEQEELDELYSYGLRNMVELQNRGAAPAAVL